MMERSHTYRKAIKLSQDLNPTVLIGLVLLTGMSSVFSVSFVIEHPARLISITLS